MRHDETARRDAEVRTRDVPAGLSERDRRLLDFEQDSPVSVARKEAAIRKELGLTAPRYQQLLGSLIEKPAALAYAPMLVSRLIRLRDARAAARTARTFEH